MSAELVSAALAAEPAAQIPGLTIRAGALHGGGRLVRDYLLGEPALGAFYAGHPSNPDAYRRKAEEVAVRLDPDARARIAPAIEPLGASAGKLVRILDGDGFFVTTGQQPALFGGPLYTLYKTLAAIRLAESLETLLRQPVLALFWIGADDHDWAEASEAALLDELGYVRTLRVRAAGDAPPLPMSERSWGPGIAGAVDELIRNLPAGTLTTQLAQHVRDAYRADATVAESFTATFRLLLRDQDIAFISSAHPALRRAAVPVLLSEAERHDVHASAVRRQSERLAGVGYEVQVAVDDDASNIMFHDRYGRDRLVRTRSGWVTRRERQAIAHDELLRRIAAEPDRFSPNVLLRPVVESAVLPTLAYVAGPGELRYFAQIGCLFQAHGVRPPVVVPRPSVQLVDAPIARTLAKLRLEPADVAKPFSDLASEVVRAQLPPAVPAALERLRALIRDGYAGLSDAAATIDPSLAGPLASARNASMREAAAAELRIRRRFKRRNDVLMEQVRRVAASLHPDGAPQERVLTPLPFMARFGPALVPAVAAALDLEPRGHVSWDGPGCVD